MRSIPGRRETGRLGLEVRVGCHTGEIELDGDDVRGIAVHIRARVAGLAQPGEVWVSRTVKDLVPGRAPFSTTAASTT